MKIISKFKDYYDYLQGIYGIDEKLILDRTEFFRLKYQPYKNTVIRFWICGYLVEGLYDGTRFLYGDALKELSIDDKKQGKDRFTYFPYLNDSDFFWYIDFTEKCTRKKVAKYPIPFEDAFKLNRSEFTDIKEELCPNDKLNCPILYDRGVYVPDYVKFPILSEFEFHKVYSAHDLWVLLTDWLGRVKDIPNNQSNTEKVLSNGFDLKTSFRHPVK